MIIIGKELAFDRDGLRSSLFNINADALGLRLYASGKTGACPNPQILVAFRGSHNQPWLAEAEVLDRETLLHRSHNSYLVHDLSQLLNPDYFYRFRDPVKQIISQMGLPHEASQNVDYITHFGNVAAKLAKTQKTELMTMSVEFGSVMNGPVTETENVEAGGGGGDDDDCAVCLEALSLCSKNDTVMYLSCSHKFHFNCMIQWFRKKKLCPLCRSVVLPKREGYNCPAPTSSTGAT